MAVENTDEVSLYEETDEENVEEENENQKGSEDEADDAALTDESIEIFDDKGDQISSLESKEDEDENQETQNQDENVDEIEFLDKDQDTTAEWTEVDLPSLEYDDRYSLEDVIEEYGADVEYEIAEIRSVPESYQVVSGEKTGTKDEVITQVEDSLNIIASGVGSADIYLVPVDQNSTDESENNPESTEYDESEGNIDSAVDPVPVENGIKASVEVKEATLTLMFLTGQSNMEGMCSSSAGYNLDASVACKEGTVYSTYAPVNSTADSITGLSFGGNYCTVDNASSFVAESLSSNTSLSGDPLTYQLNSLTTEGKGKTGPDSALAYEWNKLTEDKVWVINTAYSNTIISTWVPGGVCYERSVAVWDKVKDVYQAEIEAGHYEKGSQLVFWLQGETGTDRNGSTSDYMSSFIAMHSAMKQELDFDAFGIIMVRANTGSYTNDDEWEMTGPRIAQYMLGGSGGLSDVYVVSNANEQWVSDSGVKSYFQTAYPDGSLNYPMHNSSESTLPTTAEAVHSDIHYSQIGHNENGITAAYGMYQALTGISVPTEVQWRDEKGQEISSISISYTGDTEVLVPVANPVYTGKEISYSVSGDAISFDDSNGIVTAKGAGASVITASYNGNVLSQISVTVAHSSDLSDVAGNYTGLFYYDGTWWYLVNGVVQSHYEGVEKNEYGWWYVNDGRVDFSYTGFAHNSSGWWYIENGEVTFKKNSVIHDTEKKVDGTDSWWYVVGSEVQTSYTGVADYSNSSGWWYIKNGKVDFTANTVAKNKYGWWYVLGGKVQFDFTGLADYSNSSGWWYINDGQVLFNVETVAKNKYGWFYVKDSKVDFSYTGFAKNSYGWWYIESGEVTFKKNSVLHDTKKKVDGKDSWWYVVGSEVQSSYTGVADYSNSSGWWYIKDGKVDFSYNGFSWNSHGCWYIENGQVTFKKNSVVHDINKIVDGTDSWWYVVGSETQTGFTGLADYSNSSGWWYINNGKVTFNVETVAKNKYGWFYVKDSKVDFSYNGFAQNNYGWWYLDNGEVTFKKNSVLHDTKKKVDGEDSWWYVVGSEVQKSYTGVADYSNSSGWWYVKNGKVDFSFNGIAFNKYGFWYIQGGKVDFSYNGTCVYNGVTYTIVDGKAQK